MNLTRNQELALINIGLQKLLDDLDTKGVKSVKKNKNKNHKWTKSQRAKFSKTMKAKWANRDL